MRIAQVASLYESIPPRLYGGAERVVSYLTEAFVADGHDVTLFASGDSHTMATLVPACERALRLDDACVDGLAHHVLLLEEVAARAADFDVIHFPLSRRCSYPHITTLHGRLDIVDLEPIYRRFPDMPLISISNAQRSPLPWVNWHDTVYHGLPRGPIRVPSRSRRVPRIPRSHLSRETR